jgi:hypothetical protein
LQTSEHVQGKDLTLFGESRAIPIFLLTTLLISSVFYFLIIKSGHMGGGQRDFTIILFRLNP